MRWLPTSHQWRKWSLPSKASLLGAVLAILTIVLPLIYSAGESLWDFGCTANARWRETGYVEDLLSGFYGLADEDFDLALEGFESALERSVGNERDLHLWLAHATHYDSTKTPRDTWQAFRRYWDKNPAQLNPEDAQLLAVTRLISEGNYRAPNELRPLAEDVARVRPAIASPFLALAHLMDGQQALAAKSIAAFPDSVLDIPYTRKVMCNTWQAVAAESFSVDRDIFLESIALAWKACPENVERFLYTQTVPVLNFTVMPVAARELSHSIIGEYLEEPTQRREGLRGAVIDFGMRSGSFQALKERLQADGDDPRPILHSVKQAIGDELPISFGILRIGAGITVLAATGTTRGIESEKGAARLVDIFRVRSVTLSGASGAVDSVVYESDITPVWFSIRELEDSFMVVLVEGSFHIRRTLFFEPGKALLECDVCRQDYEDYHTGDMFFRKTGEGLSVGWEFELFNSCDANIERKVFGEVRARVLHSQLRDVEIRFPNPAVEYFKFLDRNRMTHENVAFGEVRLGGRRVVDGALRDALLGKRRLCHLRTRIDVAYFASPRQWQPNLSALLLRVPPVSILDEIEDYSPLEDLPPRCLRARGESADTTSVCYAVSHDNEGCADVATDCDCCAEEGAENSSDELSDEDIKEQPHDSNGGRYLALVRRGAAGVELVEMVKILGPNEFDSVLE